MGIEQNTMQLDNRQNYGQLNKICLFLKPFSTPTLPAHNNHGLIKK